jgi:hypothetical protein
MTYFVKNELMVFDHEVGTLDQLRRGDQSSRHPFAATTNTACVFATAIVKSLAARVMGSTQILIECANQAVFAQPRTVLADRSDWVR